MQFQRLDRKLSYFNENATNYCFSKHLQFLTHRTVSFQDELKSHVLCSHAVGRSESITSLWQPEDDLCCKQLNWRNLKHELVSRFPTTIPFIEKQMMKIGPINVYRPHHNDGVPVASYFRDRFCWFCGLYHA